MEIFLSKKGERLDAKGVSKSVGFSASRFLADV